MARRIWFPKKLARVRTCSPVLSPEIKVIHSLRSTMTHTFNFICPFTLYSVYFVLISLLFIFFILWFIHKIESRDVHSFRNCNNINNLYFHISRLGRIDCNASLHLHWAGKWTQSWKQSCWRLTHLSMSFVCSTCVSLCVCVCVSDICVFVVFNRVSEIRHSLCQAWKQETKFRILFGRIQIKIKLCLQTLGGKKK